MCGTFYLRFGLVLSCFLLIVVESETTQYPPDLPPVVVVYNKTVTDGETIQVNTSITRDVDIECTVEGGSPAVTNVTLTCDGSSKTINGYGVFFTLTISSGSPNVTCTCSADHVTGLYFKKTSFTFSTGFLFVVVDSGSLIASFTVNDQSTQFSVNVGSLLTFQASRVENITNPSWKVVGRYTGTSVVSGGTFTSKSFTVKVPATCAYNDIFDCTATLGGQTETLSVRVNVNNCPSYPPTLPPVVVVYNKTVTDGEVIQVNTSITRDVDIECTVEGGSPAVTNVTLTCDGSSKTISGYRVFFTLTIGSSSPNETCTCSADHVTGLYFNKTSFTFSTGPSYPPDLPPVVVVYNRTVTNGETIQLNTSDTKVYIDCSVEGGNPAVTNVTLVCGVSSKTVNGSGGLFTYTYSSSSPSSTCTCSARHVTGLYFKRTSFTLSTGPSYPPDLPPVVVVYNKTVTEGETLPLNTYDSKVDIKCTVVGGHPPVSSVTLACGSDTSTFDGYSASFRVTYINMKTIRCVCSARHETLLYNKTTSFIFSAANSAKNQSLGPSIVWNILWLALVILAKTDIL